MLIPSTFVRKLVRENDISRMSPEAVKLLQKTIEDVATRIASDAAIAAKHAKRKTILEEDIKLAIGER